MNELARLLDRDEVDAAEGPRGQMTLEVPREWLTNGERVVVVVPPRLVCARCDGGGCDGCGRSGALRIAGDEAERTTQLVLPATTSDHLVVRLVRPLGDAIDLAQLRIEVRITPSAALATGDSDHATLATPASRPTATAVFVATAVALVLAIAAVVAAIR